MVPTLHTDDLLLKLQVHHDLKRGRILQASGVLVLTKRNPTPASTKALTKGCCQRTPMGSSEVENDRGRDAAQLLAAWEGRGGHPFYWQLRKMLEGEALRT